ncbi:hypothetical protein CFC21_062574 [Triticum aestivum]|uniref:Cystatin domain-containing protein n=2 Tax=Triticum aestivum TaxID=4565 RepID=A0A9R1GYZ4_WHEAT|nr:hypothetical protein CFC21_062574 [Triticum aestivum]
MRTCNILLVVLAALTIVYPATSAGQYWSPIENVNEPHVQDIGRWTVVEHVKQVHDGLKFSKVTGGGEQNVAGVKYHLVVDTVNHDDKHGRYEVVLIKDNTSNMRRIISFSPTS